MKNSITRRDFLKLTAALPLGWAASKTLPDIHIHGAFQEQPQNIIVIVFDALSAHDISLLGYERETMPNLAHLAKRAIRYHNHFAGGNFTTPGTASLLTGVLPWTHRAININGRVIPPFASRNIFSAFNEYYRIAYTHNGFANTLLTQFANDIDELIPRESLLLNTYDTLISTLFKNDEDIASISWIRNMKVNEDGSAYSLFLSHLYEALQEKRIEALKPFFPRGLPTISQVNPYLLETAIATVGKRLRETPQPFVGYFHFMPPHHPYRTRTEFYNAFRDDGIKSLEKPPEILARKIIPQASLSTMRTEYDEFILYCDREFGRLYDQLESSGILDNSWLVLTSDHGEMFERGIFGHGSKVLYQPVIRIPLLVFEPGRTTGMDVYDHTSAVDVIPTLTHLTGQKLPAWGEGVILPPFATPDSTRNIFTVQAIDNPADAPLTQASVSVVREDYKLHYYFGYEETAGEEIVKLYDIRSDPEELTDLSSSKKDTASDLLNEIKVKLAETDQPYFR